MAQDEFEKSGELRPRLYLPAGIHGAGFLLLPSEGKEIPIEYSIGQVEMLLAFDRAWTADGDQLPDVRGWRSPAWIASQLRYAMEEPSLRRSVSRINKVFRETLARRAPGMRLPPLLTCKRGMGIRLAWPLQVVLPNQDEPGEFG